MKILQLCNKSPWPAKEGGSMAMTAIRKGLACLGHEVHSLVVSTPKMTVNSDEIPESYLKDGPVESVFIDTRPKALPAFRDLVRNVSYQISRFHHPDYEARLKELLQGKQWDAIILESVYMMPYFDLIRAHFNGPVILRAHNVEHVIWKRILENSRNPLKKRYLAILKNQLRKYELDAVSRVSFTACISDVDAKYFLNEVPDARLITVPFAVENDKPDIKRHEYVYKFGHIGSMDWAPNLEGLRNFVKEIWPKVIKEIPNAQLHLAGRHFPENFPKSSGVIIHGEVEDAGEFLQSLDALIVPLLSGSGVRIKIVEAMQHGVPVISTPVGAEGLDLVHREHAYICETSRQYIKAMKQLKESRVQISENALLRIEKRHSLEYATGLLINEIEKQ